MIFLSGIRQEKYEHVSKIWKNFKLLLKRTILYPFCQFVYKISFTTDVV